MNRSSSSISPRYFRRNIALGCAALALAGGTLRSETVDYVASPIPYEDPLISNTGDPLSLSIASGTAEQAGAISGAGSITKIGAGTIILSGDNTYTGDTIVSEGTLRLSSSSTFGDPETSVLRVAKGATLGNVDSENTAFLNNSVFAGDFSIDVGDGGALENFGNATFLHDPVDPDGDMTITLTGSGLACFGGTITGNNLTLRAAENVNADVMFCSFTSNALSGLVTVGSGVMLELEKIGDAEDPPVIAINGNMLIEEGASVMLMVGNQFAETSNVEVNGLLHGMSAQTNTINELTGSGTIDSDMGDTLAVNSGNFTGDITGDQAILKQGEGTLALSGPNSSYTGGTQITNGTLQAQSAKALGNGPVTVTGDATLHVAEGVALNLSGARITIANNGTATYQKDFATGESLVNFNTLTSSGSNQTEARILSGTAGDAREFVAGFRAEPSVVPASDDLRISDVFKLTGTAGDVFVLQLSYTQEALEAAGLAGRELELVIGLLTDGAWESLGVGEVVDGAWSGESTLGQYGVDTANNKVWVVTNQAGEFAVVPEPSTWMLLGLGLLAVIGFSRRRRA